MVVAVLVPISIVPGALKLLAAVNAKAFPEQTLDEAAIAVEINGFV